MGITYNDVKKDLPPGQLQGLFALVGWSDGNETTEQAAGFNIGFINSTLVISAWDGEKLVGAVRVLSDTIFRSTIYDLVVDPEYQGKGIGGEILRRCLRHFPTSEWLVQTTEQVASYYERNGFKVSKDVFLSIPCKLFTVDKQ